MKKCKPAINPNTGVVKNCLFIFSGKTASGETTTQTNALVEDKDTSYKKAINYYQMLLPAVKRLKYYFTTR